MLRIYDVALEMIPEIIALADQIAVHNRELSNQVKDAWLKVPLNLAEGSAKRGGNRRLRYETAHGEACETQAGLQAAVKARFIPGIRPELQAGLNQVIGTLTNLLYRR